MIEPMRGVAWIIATLEASTAFTTAAPGGVWRGVAPQSVTIYPLAVVQHQSGTDITGSNQVRLWTAGTYAVRIIGPADDDVALVAAADAADTALQDQHGTAQSGTIMECLREQPLGPLDEIVGGVRYTTVGGFYRLLVRPT